jgi:hypothetical protein
MIRNQRGVTAIVAAVTMIVLVGFAALAVDLGHLYVARNELQNAADAGALAGARVLYNDDGTAINTGANQIAYDAATANNSEKVPVDVNWTGGNGGDVQRGHWSFGLAGLDRGFYPSASTDPVPLWNVSTEELDANTDFVNAVRVVARREATPVASFFATIFGYQDFQLSAEAVAYIGFAGTLQPGEADQPIAICEGSLLINDNYSCSIGRWINSGQDVASSETGGWTDFNQDNPCTGGTNAEILKELVCADGNPDLITLGADIATNGGNVQSAFDELIVCWEEDTGKIRPWNLTLPVVTCPGNNVGTCEEVQGAVNLNIVWITESGEDPHYKKAPTNMAGIPNDDGGWLYGEWSSADPDGEIRWNSFVDHFNLQNVDGTDAPYAKKSIYFLPDCTPHEPAGVSGGQNFGILAKIPVLVQ